MSLSTYYLNQRISILQSEINALQTGGLPTSSDLAVVLANGNSAGVTDINMNLQDILAVNNIDLVTINGSAYPPVIAADNLQAVLTAGNDSDLTIVLKDNLVTPTSTNTISNSSVGFATPTATSSYTATQMSLNITDPLIGGAGLNEFISTTQSQIGGGVVGLPSPPYPAPDANFSLFVDSATYNPQLLMSKSAPFTNSTILNIDLNNISHNQGTGSPSPNDDFTITTTKKLVLSSGLNTIKYPLYTNANDNFLIEKSANYTTLYQVGTASPSFAVRMGAAEMRLTTIATIPPTLKLDNASFQSISQQYSGTDFVFDAPQNGRYLFNSTSTAFSNNIVMNSGGAGGQANPLLTLNNTNATGSVAMEVYKNKPTAGVAGDALFNQSVYGKDSGNAKQEYTRISHTLRDGSAGVEDGSIEFSCFVNGSVNTFLQINGNENEVNCLKPLDMTGNNIKTTTGGLAINVASSATAGAVLTLATKDNVAGSGAGLALTGNTLLSATAGGNSGQHLCLTIGGVVYKIKLELP